MKAAALAQEPTRWGDEPDVATREEGSNFVRLARPENEGVAIRNSRKGNRRQGFCMLGCVREVSAHGNHVVQFALPRRGGERVGEPAKDRDLGDS